MNDNNDDLQNAINGIVNGAEAPMAEAPAAPAEAPIEAATPDLGVPPVPPMPGEMAPEMQLPQMEAVDPAAGLMNETPAPIEGQIVAPEVTPEVAPEAAMESAPVFEAPAELATPEVAPVAGEISDVKKSMIQDLIPLMDKVQLSPEKKFAFYKEVIDENHDKTMVAPAYEAAKGIVDETAKAEALLYLIEESE